jgi:hypothetical protein
MELTWSFGQSPGARLPTYVLSECSWPGRAGPKSIIMMRNRSK